MTRMLPFLTALLLAPLTAMCAPHAAVTRIVVAS
jgi:hypothetical protein